MRRSVLLLALFAFLVGTPAVLADIKVLLTPEEFDRLANPNRARNYTPYVIGGSTLAISLIAGGFWYFRRQPAPVLVRDDEEPRRS